MDFLVIDDDKTFRDATCFLIDGEGHYAEGASSGQLGLATLKEEKFDAVLLDLNLGKENGLDVLTEILKARPNLPVVMFTAQGYWRYLESKFRKMDAQWRAQAKFAPATGPAEEETK